MAFGNPCPHDGCGGTVKIARCNGPECKGDLESCTSCCYVSECSCGDSDENSRFWAEDKAEETTIKELCKGCESCTELFYSFLTEDDDPNY